MKVFVSSVVGGFEQYRAAARKAITLLGHTPECAWDSVRVLDTTTKKNSVDHDPCKPFF